MFHQITFKLNINCKCEYITIILLHSYLQFIISPFRRTAFTIRKHRRFQSLVWNLDDPSTWCDPVSRVTGVKCYQRQHSSGHASRNPTPKLSLADIEQENDDVGDEVECEPSGRSISACSSHSDEVFTCTRTMLRVSSLCLNSNQSAF